MTAKKMALAEASTQERIRNQQKSNFHITNIARRAIRVKRRAFEIAFHLVLALLGAAAVASWAIPAAFAERGYSAVGGEWLLVILTFVAVFYAAEVQR